jgi:hypothetical protein
MSEVQKDPEDVSAGIGQKKKCEVIIKFSCNLRSKSARSTLTSPGSIRVKILTYFPRKVPATAPLPQVSSLSEGGGGVDTERRNVTLISP